MKKIIILLLLLTLTSCFNNNFEKEVNEENNKEIEANVETKENVIDINTETLNKQANDYFDIEDYQNAIVSYEELWKRGAIDGEIINNLFISYVYTLEYEKAMGILGMSIQNIGAKEELVGSYISEDGLSDRIVKIQTQIVEGGITDENIFIEHAENLYKAGDYYYELDKEKYYYAIMLHYINAYLVLDNAYEINKDNSMIYFLRCRLIMDIGSPYTFAIEEGKKAVELKDDDFRYYYRLGNAYMHNKDYLLAKENFLKGISLNSEYEKLHLNLGNVYFDLGERKKGYKSYEVGKKVCSEMCDSFYYNIGNKLYDEGKIIEAKKSYEKSLEINPNKTEAKKKLELIGLSSKK